MRIKELEPELKEKSEVKGNRSLKRELKELKKELPCFVFVLLIYSKSSSSKNSFYCINGSMYSDILEKVSLIELIGFADSWVHDHPLRL